MLLFTNKYKLYLYIFFFIFLSSIFNFEFVENYQSKFRLSKININGISNNEKKMIASHDGLEVLQRFRVESPG